MELTWSPLKVAITDLRLQDLPWATRPFVDYTFQISSPPFRWAVHKRYNQLYAFYSWLMYSKKVNVKLLPPFPGSSIFDFRLTHFYTNEQFIEMARHRKEPLEVFFDYVLNIPDVFALIESKIFFELGHALPSPLNQTVLIPLPDTDFDVTQVAVPWKVLTALGVSVVFATETGSRAVASEVQMKKGKSMIYGLTPEVKRFYKGSHCLHCASLTALELEQDKHFCNPLAWEEIDVSRYSGIILVGGHAPHYTHYLESEMLFDKLSKYWKLRRPLGAISQGVLLLSRAKNANGSSVLCNTRTTSLPAYIEEASFYIDALAFWKKGTHQILYPTSCEAALKENLSSPALFQSGPKTVGADDLFNDAAAFVVQEEFYVSARWAGDAYTFSKKFAKLVISSEYSVANLGGHEDDDGFVGTGLLSADSELVINKS